MRVMLGAGALEPVTPNPISSRACAEKQRALVSGARTGVCLFCGHLPLSHRC